MDRICVSDTLPDPAHMQVTLIGDSIRLNSQSFVRDNLPSHFQLWGPTVNCGSSRNVATDIASWVAPATADLVHINCGLHDIRFDPSAEHPTCSIKEYAAHLETIFSYLAATAPVVVWATSTPINETLHNSSKLSRRYQADLIEYNRVSVALARAFNFRVNDLHQILYSSNPESLLLPDGLHFNENGNALIGKLVADAVLAHGGK